MTAPNHSKFNSCVYEAQIRIKFVQYMEQAKSLREKNQDFLAKFFFQRFDVNAFELLSTVTTVDNRTSPCRETETSQHFILVGNQKTCKKWQDALSTKRRFEVVGFAVSSSEGSPFVFSRFPVPWYVNLDLEPFRPHAGRRLLGLPGPCRSVRGLLNPFWK